VLPATRLYPNRSWHGPIRTLAASWLTIPRRTVATALITQHGTDRQTDRRQTDALPLSGRLKQAACLYAPDAPVLDEQRLDAAIVDMMGASRREMFGAAARR